MIFRPLFFILIAAGVFLHAEPIEPLPRSVSYDRQKALLGKALFTDPLLSKDKSVACVNCHSFEHGGADPRRVSVGVGNQRGNIQSPTVFNARFNFRQFWNGRAASLEEQAEGPIHNPVEMAMDADIVEQRLNANRYYRDRFFRVYGDGSVTYERVIDAIVEFEKALVTPDSPFDRYLRGEAQLPPQALEGYRLFKELGCITCHNGINIGSNSFQKMGLMRPYVHDDSYPDRYALTKRERHKNVFKVPTLRNVALTAPYFHRRVGRYAERCRYGDGALQSRNGSQSGSGGCAGGLLADPDGPGAGDTAAMKRINFKAVASFATGIVSIFLLLFFYLQQRNFDEEYKDIRSRFHLMDSAYHHLNHEVLQTSLYAYNNQDDIYRALQELIETNEAQMQLPLWRLPQYRSVARSLKTVQEKLEAYAVQIDDFLLMNAGIKNSFVYITSLVSEQVKLFEKHPKTIILMQQITARLSQARMLSDPMFLAPVSEQVKTLQHTKLSDPKEAEALNLFLLHVTYLLHNYGEYVQTTQTIEHMGVDRILEETERTYLEAAKADIIMLDRFVVVLMTLFIIGMAMIVTLFVRAETENRRLARLQKELEHAIWHDQLTGLLSRASFERSVDTFEKPVLLLLNIDHFKHINDFYGNSVGNAILKEVSILIRQPVFEPFHPEYFRLGGDDFGIVLQQITPEHARRFAQMLVQSIESYAFMINDVEINISAACSVNNVPPLLENADLALKYIKSVAGEAVVLFSDTRDLREKARHNLATILQIKSAIASDGIVPYFQPIVALKDGAVHKYEALVRIKLADGDVLTPDAFLATAMQTPYYREITRIMLRKVMLRMHAFSCRFSFNLNMSDLNDRALADMLVGLLSEHPDAAARFDIELLESEELDDLQIVRTFIKRVKAYGCRIAIDDFGSGFSNFAYLAALPLDILKIDGSLVRAMPKDDRKRKTVETIVAFGKHLGLEIIAEFVEDAQTAHALERMGVEYAQGYYFGKPAETIVQE